jgi:hypothetical protein
MPTVEHSVGQGPISLKVLSQGALKVRCSGAEVVEVIWQMSLDAGFSGCSSELPQLRKSFGSPIQTQTFATEGELDHGW